MNTKTLYFIKHIALVAVFALGLVLVPTGTALAQKGLNKEVATPSMLSYALNLKSLSDVAVYSESGISDKGDSTPANGFRMAGASRDGASRKDLADVFSAINQLPCTQIADGDLSGKTFGPGVYCLASADLANRLTLDGQNNAGAIFVFRVGGSLSTKAGASIGLENGAQAGNVFFAMDDSAQIAEGTDFKGNILARNQIGVGADAMVDGRVLSVKGEVALSGNSILGPQQTGVVEICKALDTTLGIGLENRIFRFQIAGGAITEVPAGQCSGPIVVPTGTILIQELQTGRTTDGGTFTGNFQLTNVQQLTNLGQPNTTALVSANLPLFQATVNVVAGDIGSQTRIQFTNRFAIVAILEICKEGIDSGVTGFFNFTVDGLTQTGVTGQPSPLVQFTIPVGQCTGPIAVTVPASSTTALGGVNFSTATVREAPRTGFIFTSATTAIGATPTTLYNPFINRLVNFNVLGNGGGDATVTLVTGTDNGNGTGVGGSVSPTTAQTTVFFNNRTAPGQLKICKVAGPGIAELTPFTFEVQGVVPFDPVTVDTTVPVNTNPVLTSGIATTQNPSLGTLRALPAPGAVQQGGTVQNRTLTVLAGPVSNPGGFCQIVDRTFLVDTAVGIRETGPTTVNIVNAGGSQTGVTGQVRVSRVRSSTGILATLTATSNLANLAGTGVNGAVGTVYSGSTQPVLFPLTISGTGTTQPNTNLFPLTNGVNTGAVTGVVVPIRRGVTEVEFVNVAFSPVPLKICKVAGTGITPNTTSFSFTVTADTAGGLLSPFSSTVSVIAGPAAVNPGDQNGFCDFVPGPFGGAFLNGNSALLNGLSSFNFNSNVTITEAAATGFAVAPNGITSPTGGVITNITNRTANITNLVNGVNEVQFVNQVSTAPLPKPGKKTRFF